MMLMLHVMENSPIDICVAIFSQLKLNDLIGDDVLERFVVKYVDVDAQEMLYVLVRKKRLHTLILYITKHFDKVKCVSTKCIKELLELSIRQRSFTTTIVLCKALVKANRLDDYVCHKVVKSVVNGYFKAHGCESIHNNGCIVCKAHIAFLEYFLVLCRLQGVRNRKLVKRCYLVHWLVNKSCNHIMDVLLKNDCLTHIFEELAEDATDRCSVTIINAIIGNNHIPLMNEMVSKGYKVMVCDVIVGIAMARYDMLECLCRYFKPRWYTKKFRGILLSIASKRDDERIIQLVNTKLCTS